MFKGFLENCTFSTVFARGIGAQECCRVAQIARFRPVFYVFEAEREAQSAGNMLLTKRAARAQRGSRVHHPQGCIICAWLAIDRCIPINISIYTQGGEEEEEEFSICSDWAENFRIQRTPPNLKTVFSIRAYLYKSGTILPLAEKKKEAPRLDLSARSLR